MLIEKDLGMLYFVLTGVFVFLQLVRYPGAFDA